MKIIDPLINFIAMMLFIVIIFSIISFFGFIVSEHKHKKAEEENIEENMIIAIELLSIDELDDENKLISIKEQLKEFKNITLQLKPADKDDE